MCRQAGVILGTKRRTAGEREGLRELLTELVARSERGGPDATGVAVIREEGTPVLRKRPVGAGRFVRSAGWAAAAAAVNANNHPIRAGSVVGTHQGTVVNAGALFRRFGLPRAAEVDSEVLVRMADAAVRDRAIDPAAFLETVRHCRGSLSAVLAATSDPGRVLVLRGNRPLAFRCSPRLKAVVYATDGKDLDDALAAVFGSGRDWRAGAAAPMRMFAFSTDDVFTPDAFRLRFEAEPARSTRGTVWKGGES